MSLRGVSSQGNMKSGVLLHTSVFIDAVDMCKVYWKIDAFAVMNRK